MADNNILIGPYNVRELHEVPPMNRIPRGKFVDGLLNETVPRPRLVFPDEMPAAPSLHPTGKDMDYVNKKLKNFQTEIEKIVEGVPGSVPSPASLQLVAFSDFFVLMARTCHAGRSIQGRKDILRYAVKVFLLKWKIDPFCHLPFIEHTDYTLEQVFRHTYP